jgi:hypothetical protein
MFVQEIKKVEPLREKVTEAAKRWLEMKKAKDDPYRYITQNDIASSRERLANALMAYRAQLSVIYDTMNERGLVDYESSIIAHGDSGNLDEAREKRERTTVRIV